MQRHIITTPFVIWSTKIFQLNFLQRKITIGYILHRSLRADIKVVMEAEDTFFIAKAEVDALNVEVDAVAIDFRKMVNIATAWTLT